MDQQKAGRFLKELRHEKEMTQEQLAQVFNVSSRTIKDEENKWTKLGMDELLAVNADSYHGFVYALTDGNGRIIYGERLFCNYFMDLKYEKYIPTEYLLDGFDATTKSDYYKKMLGDE